MEILAQIPFAALLYPLTFFVESNLKIFFIGVQVFLLFLQFFAFIWCKKNIW